LISAINPALSIFGQLIQPAAQIALFERQLIQVEARLNPPGHGVSVNLPQIRAGAAIIN
jgi:hypothetical protein